MPLAGFADLHCHQFANLGFGGVEFFGQPSGALANAVPWCTPAHGPGGIGDVVGWVVKLSYQGSRTGLGHKVGGFPQFDGWPRYDSVTHQSVHVEWLERAWQGGLRVMVMLAVNNEWMCTLPGFRTAPGRGCSDMEAVDLQVQAARSLEAAIDQANGGPGQGWYHIVRDAADALATIESGRLAVVLGIEVDHLFGSYAGANLTPQLVRDAVQRYYDLGVRYVFPVHFADNLFGGTAFQNGLQADGLASNIDTPFGAISMPYTLHTEDGRSLGYEYRGGRRNVRGLTDLGRALIAALMNKGMLLDVDHMSYKTRSDVLDMAVAFGYPVLSGHAGFVDVCRGDKRHEGQLTGPEVDRIRQVGGMIAPIIAQGKIDQIATWVRPDGTSIPHVCGATLNTFAQAYLYATEKMQAGAVAMGTDFNGFAGVPGPISGPDACPGGTAGGAPVTGVTYPFQTAATAVSLDRSTIGNKTYDINTDGLAHVGMLPDTLASLEAMGVTRAELGPLLRSAESFVRLWAIASRDLRVLGRWSLRELLKIHGFDPARGIAGQVTGARGASLLRLLTSLPAQP